MPTDHPTFLALGDSYTIGTGVEPSAAWPIVLGRKLRLPTTILAKNGWRTEHLLEAIRTEPLAPPYGLVGLLIGVNDQYDGFGPDHFREGFSELLQQAVRLAGGKAGRVFVVSIPDYSYTPKGENDRAISEEIARSNELARKIAGAQDVLFLNVTPVSERAGDQPELVADDDLHPSGVQYRTWVDEVLLNGVRQLLST